MLDLQLENLKRPGLSLQMRCNIQNRLPNGVSSLAMWGRTKFAFGKFEKEKKNYKTVFDEDPGYVAWCRKHLTESTAKGPALDWSKYIKVRDFTSGKGDVPCYSGTTQECEFCD